jgi:hypothetical protein
MGVDVIALFMLNLGVRWGWVAKATLRPLYPRKEPHFPLQRRLGGPQGRSGWVWRKSLSPLGYEPQTVQHVVSRYTDYAIPAPTTTSTTTTTKSIPIQAWTGP